MSPSKPERTAVTHSTLSEPEHAAAAADPRRARLSLLFEAGAAVADQRALQLERADEWLIGRSAACALPLDDGWSSGEHVRLSRGGSGWLVEDLRSKNGLWVNGVRHLRTQLRDGDVLEVGRSFLLFEESQRLASGDSRAGGEPPLPEALRTADPSLHAQFANLAAIAPSRVPVLLLGQTGTGKELAARAVHALSGRTGELVAVNCGALPEGLVASELFGARRGAFSGASDREGLVTAAHGGTLLLDEVGDLPLAAQATLLRALQEGEVTPLGSVRTTAIDVRFIAATHHPLEARVAEGRFRQDLLARLDGFRLALPPLVSRRCDLGWLSHCRLKELGVERARFSSAALRALINHAWPNNVRELHLVLDRAAQLAAGGELGVQQLPPALVAPHAAAAVAAPAEARGVEEEAQREKLMQLLAEHDGNVAAVARTLGKGRMQIHRWARRYGLSLADFRGAARGR